MYVEKYQALGNDFLVVEKTDFPQGASFAKIAQKLCERKSGVGADGLVVVEKNTASMDFFNADGSSAVACGNALRCVTAYLNGFNKSKEFVINTRDGKKTAKILRENPFLCKIGLGEVEFFLSGKKVATPVLSALDVDGKKLFFYQTKVCVPHAVVMKEEWKPFAEQICRHPCFAEGTNVDFVSIKKGEVYVETFERGVGWTDACGTGAGAVGAVCAFCGVTAMESKVNFARGSIGFCLDGKKVSITGGAQKVFMLDLAVDTVFCV